LSVDSEPEVEEWGTLKLALGVTCIVSVLLTTLKSIANSLTCPGSVRLPFE